jgi:hypothetical protein
MSKLDVAAGRCSLDHIVGPFLSQCRRLGQRAVIKTGDYRLVQQFEVACTNGNPDSSMVALCKKLLRAGHGWRLIPVPEWAVGKKVYQTDGYDHPLSASFVVYRPNAKLTDGGGQP